MRQGIVERIKRSLYSLKRAKKKGIKVGELTFKSEIKSIPLKQYQISAEEKLKRLLDELLEDKKGD